MSAEADAALAARLAAVRARIDEAAARAGRNPSDVTLVGVSKTFSAARVRAAVAAGLRDVGESYVQEARTKIPEVLADPRVGSPPRWHLVGKLQRNKAREAARLFQLIHSVDRIKLANALGRAPAPGESARPTPVLLQVNLSGETQKGGAPPEDLPDLLAASAEVEWLAVSGLMTVPAAHPEPEASRDAFVRLRELRDRLREAPGGGSLRHLSMGMSHDFEVAVEEGATIVRVGTAIFGPREE